MSNVIQFRKGLQADSDGPESQMEAGTPYLTYDPDTKLWGIIVDSVEVIAGLDPVGIRERMRTTSRSTTEEK